MKSKLPGTLTENFSNQIGQYAEWEPAKVILLCQPALETAFDVLQPNAANFLHPFSIKQAQNEHQAFRTHLEGKGIKVIDLRQAMTYGVNEFPAARQKLESFARSAICLDTSFLTSESALQCQSDFEEALAVQDAETLVELILLRPTIHLSQNPEALDPTTALQARYEISPASAYYLRDPLITTTQGCVIGRLRLEKRRPENDLAAFALEQLGIEPILSIEAPGCLEGGDFIPGGDFVLQGVGLLTNEEGVSQCLENRVYGYVEVAIVKDSKAEMDEMHLDTYFALLGPDLCLLCVNRIGTPHEPRLDIYQPDGSPGEFKYRYRRSVLFTEYLEEKGFKIIPFSKSEQANFASNGLLTAPYHWVGVDQAGMEFYRRLQEHGVQVETISYNALTGGYGGPHCSSQVLARGT